MRSDAQHYYSDIAAADPPVFFPEPNTPISFNFDQGLADEATFPLNELARLHVEVLERDGGRALEYLSFGLNAETGAIDYAGMSYMEIVLGNRALRAELAKWLGGKTSRDLNENNFILTSGSVQAIALTFNALVSPDDGVLVESSSFPYALRYLDARRADVRTVDIDDDGMDPASLRTNLEAMRAEGVKPKLLYIIATFQLPTGMCTTLERRKEILALAEEFDFLILEDNVYGDLRVEGEPIPTMFSMDENRRVLQSNGFSKSIAPGLRLGWMAASEDLIQALGAVRQDLGVSQLTSRVMTEFVASGRFDEHIENANKVYRRKRDIAAAAVREHCAPYITFRMPMGGFYLWLEMDTSLDWEQVQVEAERKGVMFRPGERFMTKNEKQAGSRFIRLAYSHVGDAELVRGIEALGEAIKTVADANDSVSV
jgi:2-aminoadipate transaminase